MTTLERIGIVEAQLEATGSLPAEGDEDDDVKRHFIMCSLMRSLHDYSIKYAPNINYYDGKRLIYDRKKIK